MVEAILTEAGMKGVRDEHLPYPMSEPSLSKLDNATDEALSNMATSTTCTHIRHTWGTLEVT
jgi:hypothetical protein